VLVVRNGSRPPRRARLVALGSHLPERVLTNADLERIVDTNDEWIVSRTGIRERRVSADGEAASDLAAHAARQILPRGGLAPEDLDVLMVLTATADYLFPSTSSAVCGMIGATNAASFDLMAGCTGFVYGLQQACALVESGQARSVLVVGAEVLTKFTDYTDRSTCILFGDGAGGALVVAGDDETTTGFLGFDLGTEPKGSEMLRIPGGGGRMPRPAPGHQFIEMNGREVFRFATRAMVDSTTRLLAALEMDVEEIDLVVAHQANLRIIEHAAKRLGVPEERLYNNVDRFGNTSSASIPIALAEAREVGRLHAGDLLLLVGFGAGLTWGSTVVRYEPLEGDAAA
jgi:3-oxoacyl-[acyl-carrier-protein] synthase III